MADNVLIGIIESELQIEDQMSDSSSYRTNKIGGYPVLSCESNSGTIGHFNSLVCDLCSKTLTFVSQIYCPIDDTLTDRVIYLFVCINTDCSHNKWFALRSVTPFIDTSGSPQESSGGTDVWIDGQSDWDEEPTDPTDNSVMDSTTVCTDLMTKLCVESNGVSSKDPTLITNKCFEYFRPLYVSVIDEPIGDESDDKHINQLIQSYESFDGKRVCDKSATNSGETFEQNFLDTIYRSDRKNYQFFKRLSICPKQVIRYQWMGTPLVNSDSHKLVVPQCETCGADRCFEMQLMPALIRYLKPLSDSLSNVDFDFASILVYTCSKNCVKSDSFCKEFCITLSDPDNAFIDKIHNKLK